MPHRLTVKMKKKRPVTFVFKLFHSMIVSKMIQLPDHQNWYNHVKHVKFDVTIIESATQFDKKPTSQFFC